jgi:hypothetical protein
LRLLLPERLIGLFTHFYISRSLKSTPNSFLRRTVRVYGLISARITLSGVLNIP